MVIDCNAVSSDVVQSKEDTASSKSPVETHTLGNATIAQPQSTNQTMMLSLPQHDPIPVLGASTKSKDDIQVLELRKGTSKEIKINEEDTKSSELSHKLENLTTIGKKNVEPSTPLEQQITTTNGEEKGNWKLEGEEQGERKLELAAPVEEPTKIAEGEEVCGSKLEPPAPSAEEPTKATEGEDRGDRKMELATSVEEPALPTKDGERIEVKAVAIQAGKGEERCEQKIELAIPTQEPATSREDGERDEMKVVQAGKGEERCERKLEFATHVEEPATIAEDEEGIEVGEEHVGKGKQGSERKVGELALLEHQREEHPIA